MWDFKILKIQIKKKNWSKILKLQKSFATHMYMMCLESCSLLYKKT
jgi:hypothetical protein